MESDKPKRIEGDPEGYEPVFIGEDEPSCTLCALNGRVGCENAPCLDYRRPGGRGVYYVKAGNAGWGAPREAGRTAWDIGKELDEGVWFKGGDLWYRDAKSAGEIGRVRVEGKEFRP
jgi:hypothetical protein